MKIILSPAKSFQTKTQNIQILTDELLFKKESTQLFKKLKQLSVEKIQTAMKLSKKLAGETHLLYQKHSEASVKTAALEHYSGLAYRQLNLLAYSSEQLAYLDNHLRILSALYGILRPRDGIHPYRLDFVMALPEFKLKQVWKNKLSKAFVEEDWILNLASEEFSSLISHPKMHTVEFYELRNEQWFINSAEAKKARGKYLELCMLHHVLHIEDLKPIELYGYTQVEHDQQHSVYLRKQ